MLRNKMSVFKRGCSGKSRDFKETYGRKQRRTTEKAPGEAGEKEEKTGSRFLQLFILF